MKNARIHLIYLAIIGFLAYQYWTKAQALNDIINIVEEQGHLLQTNNEVVINASRMLFDRIRATVLVSPGSTNEVFYQKAQTINAQTANLTTWLKNLEDDFIAASGVRFINGYSNKTTKAFFTEPKLAQLKDSLVRFQKSICNIADSSDINRRQSKYTFIKPITEDSSLQRFKEQTAIVALAELKAIQNQVRLHNNAFLEYCNNHVGTPCWFEPIRYKVAILPKKASIVEGETFEADVYLARYKLINYGDDISFLANNRVLQKKEGIAYLSQPNLSIGKKKVKAEARLRNPLTGQISTFSGELEYEVFSKHSRDIE